MGFELRATTGLDRTIRYSIAQHRITSHRIALYRLIIVQCGHQAAGRGNLFVYISSLDFTHLPCSFLVLCLRKCVFCELDMHAVQFYVVGLKGTNGYGISYVRYRDQATFVLSDNEQEQGQEVSVR